MVIEVSGTAWSSDPLRLPEDTRHALETDGGTELLKVLDQDSPRPRHPMRLSGCSYRRPALLAAYENLVGSGPTRSPRSSPAIASISLSLSQSDTASRFPRIRSGVTDFDRATFPSCKFHARRTRAALTLWRSAISTMTGNRTSTSASARWLQDSVTMPCSWWYAAEVLLLEEWLELDLVDGRHDVAHYGEAVEVLWLEV